MLFRFVVDCVSLFLVRCSVRPEENSTSAELQKSVRSPGSGIALNTDNIIEMMLCHHLEIYLLFTIRSEVQLSASRRLHCDMNYVAISDCYRRCCLCSRSMASVEIVYSFQMLYFLRWLFQNMKLKLDEWRKLFLSFASRLFHVGCAIKFQSSSHRILARNSRNSFRSAGCRLMAMKQAPMTWKVLNISQSTFRDWYPWPDTNV